MAETYAFPRGELMAGKTAVVMGVANDKSSPGGSPASWRPRARR
jgi:hypothetical protein